MSTYHKVYERKSFMILEGKSEYIVINKNKPFENGHTHLKNYHTAVWLINLASHNTVPKHISDYLLESLIRISKDRHYIDKLNSMRKQVKKHKGASR